MISAADISDSKITKHINLQEAISCVTKGMVKSMSVTVSKVIEKSPADKKGIKPGDTLISINGFEIMDVLDYRFYINESRLKLEILRGEKKKNITLRKNEFDDIGLEFETYLMDKQHHCKNKCVFCFIDQLPKGMRESLYFKDDDSRLSFLFGNYITLTNLSEHEIERIKKMHISPINISVHTTNPDLRVKMMKNKNAGRCLSIIREFADIGIKMNTQLVLCPGWNDGGELIDTLNDLASMYPSIQSIAAVPVGLTEHRDGLETLEPYNEKTAGDVLDIIENFGDKFKMEHGTRLCFPADEFYLKAGRPMPEPEFYEDFAQLENGVGLWASLKDEFTHAVAECEYEINRTRRITIATGTSASVLMKELIDVLQKKWHNIDVNIIAIKNNFFGGGINVAGLLTGTDMIDQLKSYELGDEILIPAVMLRHEKDVFLDGLSPSDMETALKTKVTPVENDGIQLLEAILGVK